jgi:acyl-CoA synthetase (AMP-forming)/AMP-acid ligase II
MQATNEPRVERLFRALRDRSADTAVVEPGGTAALTYGELGDRVDAVAVRLRELGLAPGDRVAIWADPAAEFFVALLAIYRSRAIAVPINTRYRAAEARHVLDDSGAVAILHDRPVAVDAIASANLRLRIAFGEPSKDERSLTELSTPGVRLEEPGPRDADGALIVYTSGTTGPSKGALLSFRAIVDNMLALTELWRWSPDDRLVLALPLFHVHGLCIGLHGALLHGMTSILLPKFTPEGVVQAFRDHGGTLFMGVPTMYARLLEHLETHPPHAEPLARGRLFTAGSAALAPEHLERFETLTGHRIVERYGMTETLITLSNPHDGERRAGAVGRPVPGCEIRIVDDDLHDVPDDTPGELLVRSNGMMERYWGRPEATAAAFHDGWFWTGDVVRRDADGYVRIVGRKSIDIIKSGGFKIAAKEIEAILERHPAVREAAVLGLSDPKWGERITAVVVLAPEVELANPTEALPAFVGEHLADYKRPRTVVVLEALPRNALGKVEKVRLRQRLERSSS